MSGDVAPGLPSDAHTFLCHARVGCLSLSRLCPYHMIMPPELALSAASCPAMAVSLRMLRQGESVAAVAGVVWRAHGSDPVDGCR